MQRKDGQPNRRDCLAAVRSRRRNDDVPGRRRPRSVHLCRVVHWQTAKRFKSPEASMTRSCRRSAWDLTPYVGKKMFIKVVDQSTTGWGHVTVDDFQFDAKVLTESPETNGVRMRSRTDEQRPDRSASRRAPRTSSSSSRTTRATATSVASAASTSARLASIRWRRKERS